ncbi:MAG: hypothetical protein K9I84_16410 [Leadbetterella sp.]|nr:hypothetical protein [Leadbetterella sp.]
MRELDSGTYDYTLEMLVREKMYEHDVAARCTGRGQPDTAIMLRPKGVKVYKNGGWKKYLVDYAKEQEEKRKRDQKPHIKVDGNAIIGDNNSNNSLFQGLEETYRSQTLPKIQPHEKHPTSDEKKIKMSIPQFIVWLLTFFASGIAIGIATMNYLKSKG